MAITCSSNTMNAREHADDSLIQHNECTDVMLPSAGEARPHADWPQ